MSITDILLPKVIIDEKTLLSEGFKREHTYNDASAFFVSKTKALYVQYFGENYIISGVFNLKSDPIQCAEGEKYTPWEGCPLYECNWDKPCGQEMHFADTLKLCRYELNRDVKPL